MRFEGEFRVPGDPRDVLARFADVSRMAQCMPGATIDGRDDAGLYLGSMLVSFGPKQIKFKGKVEATTDSSTLSGGIHVRGAADMKASARADVRVTYALQADPAAAAPTTIVSLSSEAQMGGVLATFAQTGGVVVTRALMDEFAKRVAEEFSRDERVAEPATAEVSRQTPAPSAALSGQRILWRIVRARLLALFRA